MAAMTFFSSEQLRRVIANLNFTYAPMRRLEETGERCTILDCAQHLVEAAYGDATKDNAGEYTLAQYERDQYLAGRVIVWMGQLEAREEKIREAERTLRISYMPPDENVNRQHLSIDTIKRKS